MKILRTMRYLLVAEPYVSDAHSLHQQYVRFHTTPGRLLLHIHHRQANSEMKPLLHEEALPHHLCSDFLCSCTR